MKNSNNNTNYKPVAQQPALSVSNKNKEAAEAIMERIARSSGMGTLTMRNKVPEFSDNVKEKFDSYRKYDITPSPYDEEDVLDKQRAKNQGILEEAGRALGQAALNEVVLGTLRGFSDIFDATINSIRQGENDYTNPVSQALEEAQDEIRKNLEIYQKNNDGGFNLGDTAWWMNGLVNAATTVSLLLPALGYGKVLSYVGKTTGLGKAAKWATRKGTHLISKEANSGKIYQTLKGAGETGTMALLSRTGENYQEARETYKNVYDTALSELKNMDDDERQEFLKRNAQFVNKSDKEIAESIAQMSAGNVFRNDYWMLLMDIPQFKSLSSIWKGTGVASKAATRAIRKANKESIEKLIGKGLSEEAAEKTAKTFSQRLGNLFTLENLKKGTKNIWNSTEGLMLSEGVEEGFQGIQQSKGEEYGESYFNPYLTRKTLGDYLQDESIWEQAFWGVAGGLLFQGASKGLRRLEDKLNAKINKGKLTNAEYKALMAGENKARIEEIESRFTNMEDLKTKLNLINNGFNPYSIKKDDRGQYVIVNGEVQYDTINNQEDYERLKTETVNEFLTNFVLNAVDTGNYNLLKEFVSNKEFAEYFKETGINTDQFLESQLIETMDNIYNKYIDNYNNVIDNSNDYNENIVRLAARNITRKQLTVEALDRYIDRVNQEIDYANLSDKSHYEKIAKREIIKYKLEEIDKAINEINRKKNDRDVFYSKQAYNKELKELQEQKRNLYKQLENADSSFNFSNVISDDLENTLKAADDLYNSLVNEFNNELTSFNNLSKTTQQNLYAKAAYEVYKQEILEDLPQDDNARKYYKELYDNTVAQFIDIADYKFSHAYNKVYKYVKKSEDPNEAIKHLLKDDLDSDTNLGKYERQSIKEALEILRFGAYDRQAFNNALALMVAGEKTKREKQQEESKENKVNDENVSEDVANKINNNNSSTGNKQESELATENTNANTNISNENQGNTPVEGMNVESSSAILDDNSAIFAVDDESEVGIIQDESGQDVYLSDLQSAEETKFTNEPYFYSYEAVRTLIPKNAGLWRNVVKDGYNSDAYIKFANIVKDELIIKYAATPDEANAWCEKAISLFISQITNAQNNASNPQSKPMKALMDNINRAIGFNPETGNSLYENITSEEALSDKRKSIKAVFDEFVAIRNLRKSDNGKYIVDLKDVFVEISKMFDDANINSVSILYLYKDISNFVDYMKDKSSEYIFVNKDFLKLNSDEFLQQLKDAKSKVVTVSPFMHFGSSMYNESNPVSALSVQEKIKLLNQVRDKGVKLNIVKDNSGIPQSIGFKVNYNGKEYELGYLSLVSKSVDNNTLSSTLDGVQISLTKDKEGVIRSSQDRLFNYVLSNDKVYDALANWFIYKNKPSLFAGAGIPFISTNEILKEVDDVLLNDDEIKAFAESINLDEKYSKYINRLKKNKVKEQLTKEQFLLNKISNILFYNAYKKDNTEGAAATRYYEIKNKIGIKESYDNFKKKQYDNFLQTFDIYTKLLNGKEVTAILRSDSTGIINYDQTKFKQANRLGISKEITEHPVIYFDGNKGIDENGKIYMNIPGLGGPSSLGSMGIVFGTNQGEYIVNDDETLTNIPGANIALINSSKKPGDKIKKALIEELNAIYSNYHRIVSDKSISTNSKNAAYENFYNSLLALFGNTETKLFDNIIISKGLDMFSIVYRDNEDFVPILKVYKYKGVVNDNGVRRYKGRILTDEELENYVGGNIKITIPNLDDSDILKDKNKSLEALYNFIADNVVYNKSRFAVTNASKQNVDGKYISKVDGEIKLKLGSFEQTFKNYAEMIVKLNMFTFTQQGGENSKYIYETLPDSFYLEITDTITPEIDETVLKNTVSEWISDNGIQDGEEVETYDFLELLDVNDKQLEYIKNINNQLSRENSPLFFSQTIKLNADLPSRTIKVKNPDGTEREKILTPGGHWDGKYIEIGKSAIANNRKDILLRILIHENIHRISNQSEFFEGEIGEKRINDINEIYKIFKDELDRDKNTSNNININRLKEKFELFSIDYSSNPKVLAEEFLAEVMSDKHLREYLNEIEIETQEETNKKKSLLQRIFEYLAELFGIKTNDDSLLKEFYNVLGDIDSSTAPIETTNVEEVAEAVNPVMEDSNISKDDGYKEPKPTSINDISIVDDMPEMEDLFSSYENLTSDEIKIDSFEKDKTNNPFGIDSAPDMNTYLKQVPNEQKVDIANSFDNGEVLYVCS